MSIKLNSSSGSITIAPEDGTGNVDVTIPRAGVLSAGANSVTDTELNSAKLNGIEAGATADQTKADIEALGIAASSITGALPAISGANLTNLPSGGASDIDGLTDGTTSGTGNTGLGDSALDSITSATNNTAVGTRSLPSAPVFSVLNEKSAFILRSAHHLVVSFLASSISDSF